MDVLVELVDTAHWSASVLTCSINHHNGYILVQPELAKLETLLLSLHSARALEIQESGFKFGRLGFRLAAEVGGCGGGRLRGSSAGWYLVSHESICDSEVNVARLENAPCGKYPVIIIGLIQPPVPRTAYQYQWPTSARGRSSERGEGERREGADMMDGEEDGSLMSFPPRPSSPLPISTGPDNEKYIFSPSPSPSPRVSPLGSAHLSTMRLPLVNGNRLNNDKSASAPSSFFVDQCMPHHHLASENSSCLREL
ncbi:hypothetical protein Cgig2_031195 [Carnegiea gigantea]|uniref:Uncharacterized protein n=1 Tax=Carnegiea gigantea TaxID=171969 RepID=A0A9Q1QMC4_9CARY|nr:hypothetical protein Cgig2_031195 [Carnegiea gigantea]